MTRRNLIAQAAAILGAPALRAAGSRIVKSRISVITDEAGLTQADAIGFARHYSLQWVELRNVPGSAKEFASLTAPELKAAAAELGAAKLRVSVLHTDSLKPGVVNAALAVTARQVLSRNSDPAAAQDLAAAFQRARIQLLIEGSPEARSRRVTVNVADTPDLEAFLKTLERENFQGEISLQTAPDKADEAMRELMHAVGKL